MTRNELLLLSFTAITALATLLTAAVAAWNARTAAKEYRWARRPWLRVDWEARGDSMVCIVQELTNRPTLLQSMEVHVASMPARSRSTVTRSTFERVYKAPLLNVPLLANKATHSLNFLPFPPDTYLTTWVVLTASAGGPPLTQHFYTNLRRRTSDSTWQIHNDRPYDMPSPTFVSAISDRFCNWWHDLQAKDG